MSEGLKVTRNGFVETECGNFRSITFCYDIKLKRNSIPNIVFFENDVANQAFFKGIFHVFNDIIRTGKLQFR